MMPIVVLGALTFGLMLILKYAVTPKYGEDVSSRFIERANYIPSQNPTLLDRTALTKWLADERNREAIAAYVVPVLFPFDVFFLVSLGLLLGFSSVALSASLTFLTHVPVWIWWAFPVAYIATDLVEDAVVAAIFKSAIRLTDGSYRLLRTLTALKFATVGVAIGQVAFLGALYGLTFSFPASG